MTGEEDFDAEKNQPNVIIRCSYCTWNLREMCTLESQMFRFSKVGFNLPFLHCILVARFFVRKPIQDKNKFCTALLLIRLGLSPLHQLATNFVCSICTSFEVVQYYYYDSHWTGIGMELEGLGL